MNLNFNAILAEHPETTQLVVVEASGIRADVILMEKNGNDWAETHRAEGWIGKLGVGEHKEGVPTTPEGLYTFGVAFGLKENPGTAFSYTQVDDSHYWVDDPNSVHYNQFLSSPGGGDWKSAEHLIDQPVAYSYALSLNYNLECIPEKGSAIFFHCTTNGPTAGCIAVPEADMTHFLQVLKTDACIYIPPLAEV